MSERAYEARPIARGPGGRVGIIDIGSNSIRLVVYDRLSRAPVPVFNEKVLCGLGRDLVRTARLNPDGVAMALTNLARFTRLLDGMGVGHVDVIATAAVRDAEDGDSFVAGVKRTCGLDITVISGAEEARLSAMGVLSGTPGADGVMGDMGGGSLELVGLDRHTIAQQVTLPLGPFRLMDGKASRPQIRALVGRHFEAQEWLAGYRARSFYPVGGAWRTLAKVHMSKLKHPVHVIHQYTAPGPEIQQLAGLISRQGKSSLERLADVNKRRLETLPYAALVMEQLLKVLAPTQVVFSAYGLREGHLFDLLTDDERSADPLLHTCAEIARRLDRFGEASRIADWTGSLFVGESVGSARLRRAAGLLSDFCWAEHQDYRADHAFMRTLRLSVVGLDHVERAFLAATIYVRYGGTIGDRITKGPCGVLTPEMMERATLIGETLRLAHTLSGGASSLLERTRLAQSDDDLVLWLPDDEEALVGDVVQRRLDAVARVLGRAGRIAISPAEEEVA